jgi:hypothetical protein|uniref:Uncharacterized protein n=1 Tax=Picea glauca TaxID=3330 RepID=A0A124GMR8_PICGL|nr:hypothetical protein ABT39_MTgene1604 [Picea glauca]QHR86545.1 hypothetical protein Q903MT_gene547 [Picea sitchensis]
MPAEIQGMKLYTLIRKLYAPDKKALYQRKSKKEALCQQKEVLCLSYCHFGSMLSYMKCFFLQCLHQWVVSIIITGLWMSGWAKLWCVSASPIGTLDGLIG